MRKIIFMLATLMTVSFSASAELQAPATATPSEKALEIKLAPGQASIQRDVSYSFDFGSVMVGMASYRSFSLSNSGNMNLYIDSVSLSGADFTAAGSCPAVLRPREYCTFEVRFSPWIEGFKTGAMYIETSAGMVNLYFSGWATRRY